MIAESPTQRETQRKIWEWSNDGITWTYYPEDVQDRINQAFHSGAASVPVTPEHILRFETMRQEQRQHPSKWRAVRSFDVAPAEADTGLNGIMRTALAAGSTLATYMGMVASSPLVAAEVISPKAMCGGESALSFVTTADEFQVVHMSTGKMATTQEAVEKLNSGDGIAQMPTLPGSHSVQKVSFRKAMYGEDTASTQEDAAEIRSQKLNGGDCHAQVPTPVAGSPPGKTASIRKAAFGEDSAL